MIPAASTAIIATMKSAAWSASMPLETHRLGDVDIGEPNDRQVASQIDTILDSDGHAGIVPIDHEPCRRAV